MPSAPQDTTSLRTRLRDFYDDYAAALDDMNLETWVDFFTDDGFYRVTSAENYDEGLELSLINCRGKAMLNDRVAALRLAVVYEPRKLRHLVSGVRITGIEGGTISAKANFAIFESLSDRETHIFMAGQYVDEIIEQNGALKFKQRAAVYDNFRVRTTLVIPV